jgi:hypothetical protein
VHGRGVAERELLGHIAGGQLQRVSYRLTQAEELLGQPLTDNVLEVGAALVIAQTIRHGLPQPGRP